MVLNRSSIVVGNTILVASVIPIALYVLDYIDVIRPDGDPSEWGLLVFAAGLISLGSLLVKGEGDTVADVFINLKNKLTK